MSEMLFTFTCVLAIPILILRKNCSQSVCSVVRYTVSSVLPCVFVDVVRGTSPQRTCMHLCICYHLPLVSSLLLDWLIDWQFLNVCVGGICTAPLRMSVYVSEVCYWVDCVYVCKHCIPLTQTYGVGSSSMLLTHWGYRHFIQAH